MFRKLICIAAAMCILFCGCAFADSLPTYELKFNDVDVSAYEDITSLCEYSSRFIEIDEANAINELLGSSATIERIDAAGAAYTTGTDADKKMACIYDDGKKAGMQPSGLKAGFFYVDNSYYILDDIIDYNIIVDPNPNIAGQTSNLPLVSRSLDGMPFEQTQEMCMDWFARLGIDNMGSEVVCSADKESLIQAAEANYSEGSDYSKQDIKKYAQDVHVFRFCHTLDGIKVNSFLRSLYISSMFNPYGTEGGYIEMSVADNKVIDMYGRDLKSFTKVSDPKPILSYEQASAILDEHFGKMILTHKLTVTDAELIYYEIVSDKKGEEFSVVPVWCFSVDDNYGYLEFEGGGYKGEYIEKTFYMVNAFTGEMFTLV